MRIFVWVMLLASLGLAQDKAISAVDNIPLSHLSLSGSITCASDPVDKAGMLHRTQNGSLLITNNTKQEIITMVIDVRAICSGGPAEVFHFRHDMFAKAHGLLPGATFEVPLEMDENASAKGVNLPAEFSVHTVFVQMADGSIPRDENESASINSHRESMGQFYQKLLVLSDADLANSINTSKGVQSEVQGAADYLSDMLEKSDMTTIRQYLQARLSTVATRKQAWGQQ